MAFSQWDIGGCNCCPVLPCRLPRSNLVVEILAHANTESTLTYEGGSSCTWTSDCISNGTSFYEFSIEILVDGSTQYTLSEFAGPGCTGAETDLSCTFKPNGTIVTDGLIADEQICSPLQLTFSSGPITVVVVPPTMMMRQAASDPGCCGGSPYG